MTDLKVVELYESNYRDPAATLRKIASGIDSGEYGPVGCIAVVTMGDTLSVEMAGEDSDACAAGMVLHAGFMKLSKAVMDHGT